MYGVLTNNFNLNRKEDKRKAFEKQNSNEYHFRLGENAF